MRHDIFREWKIGGALLSVHMTDSQPELPWLVRLMTTGEPLSDLTPEQLIRAVRSARQARENAQERAANELHQRGWTWEKIGGALGVSQSTAFRWANPEKK